MPRLEKGIAAQLDTMAIDSPSALGVARMRTVAFSGIDVKDVDVQVQISAGLPAFTLVGLPDKAVAELRERVRSALGALGLGLPPKRITINLAPADLAKEGSHFDLPIALALLVGMGALPGDATQGYLALGELALDGAILRVAGVLPAAVAASARELGLICPGGLRRRGRLAGQRHRDPGGGQPARPDQPLQRLPGPGPARRAPGRAPDMAVQVKARSSELYEEDLYAWSEVQADLLRRRRFAELDLEHVVEEIEDVGGSLYREVRSRIRTIMEHFLKLEHSATTEPRAGWERTIRRGAPTSPTI